MFLDALFLAGLATAAVGLWWIYPPAALIAGGVTVCALAGFGAVNERRQRELKLTRARARQERTERMRILRQEGVEGGDDE